jgi:hypothetical protein
MVVPRPGAVANVNVPPGHSIRCEINALRAAGGDVMVALGGRSLAAMRRTLPGILRLDAKACEARHCLAVDHD